MFKFFNVKKDSIISKKVAIIAIDTLVYSIDRTVNGGQPALSVAWNMCKGLYEAGIELRQERAIEFIEMVRDNPGVFTKYILNSREFQDGFVYTFEKYLRERIEEKRQIVKKIFLGFSRDENKQDFKLERYLFTLEQLSLEDIEVVKTFSDGTIQQWHRNQFPEMTEERIRAMASQPLNIGQIGDLILSKMKGMTKFSKVDYAVETLTRLSSLGLIIGGIDVKWDYSKSNFKESDFGNEFMNYLIK